MGGTLASRTRYVSTDSPSRVQLFVIIWTVAHQVPLFMTFPRQECWGGLPFPSPGDLLNPGIEPTSPASLALQVNSSVLHHLDIVTCTGYSHSDFDIWEIEASLCLTQITPLCNRPSVSTLAFPSDP